MLPRVARVKDARVVDPELERTAFVGGPGDGTMRLGIPHVVSHRPRTVSDGFGGGRGCRSIEVGGQHGKALRRESGGDLSTESLPCSGDDGDFHLAVVEARRIAGKPSG